MIVDDFVKSARDLGVGLINHIISFFGSSTDPASQELRSIRLDEFLTTLVVLMSAGILLQDIYVANLNPSEIVWVKRTVNQLIFWTTGGLLTSLTLRFLAKSRSAWTGMIATMSAISIAFVCGAFAGAIGHFLMPVWDYLGFFRFPFMSRVLHIVVQIAILLRYLPREIARYSGCERPSLCALPTIFYVVLVDLFVVYARDSVALG